MTRRLGWEERKRRAGEQRDVSGLLDRVLAGYGVERSVREHRIVLEWGTVVGGRIAARTWPDGLRRGVLWVRVANSAWLQELAFLKQHIAERANALLGDPPLVHDVRLHIGARRDEDGDDVVAALARRVHQDRRRRARRPTPATGAALDQIEREAAEVDDAELRDAIRDARIKLGL
jgi:hypothetical protein